MKLMLATIAACIPTLAAATTANELSVSASAIARAYSHDRGAADLDFVGHPLLVTGDISKRRRAASATIVNMRSGGGAPIAARFAGVSGTRLATLPSGATIMASCRTIDGRGPIPLVSDCTLRAVAPTL